MGRRTGRAVLAMAAERITIADNGFGPGDITWDQGAEDLRLPRYPSDAQLASRNGPIVVTASQTRRFNPSSVTTRHIKIVFERVG